MENNQLGVRPYPLASESLTQYLLRLAHINGGTKLSSFLYAIGMKKPKKMRFAIWSTTQLSDLAQSLSIALNREVPEVIEMHERRPKQHWLYKKSRLLEELLYDSPRFCHHCLAEKPIFDWRWSVGTIARCQHHLTPLMDTCPSCNTVLTWNAIIFDACPTCHFKWKDISISRFESIALSPLEKLLWPSEDGTLLASESVINDVCLAIHMTARPNDVYHQSYKRIPQTAHYHELIIHALQCLESQCYYDRWAESCIEFWGEHTRLLDPVNELSQQITGHYQGQTDWQLDPYPTLDHFIQPARMNNVNKQPPEQAEFHLSFKQFCRVFKLTTGNASQVIEAGEVVDANHSYRNHFNVAANKIFNLKNTVEYLTPLAKNKKVDRLTSIIVSQGDKLIESYLCTYGNLLRAMLANEIPGELVDADDLSRVRVDKCALQRWLDSYSEVSRVKSITLKEAAKALDVTQHEITELINAQHFYYAKWYKGSGYIDCESFIDYLLKHRSELE